MFENLRVGTQSIFELEVAHALVSNPDPKVAMPVVSDLKLAIEYCVVVFQAHDLEKPQMQHKYSHERARFHKQSQYRCSLV
jgi:hypothetical protein